MKNKTQTKSGWEHTRGTAGAVRGADFETWANRPAFHHTVKVALMAGWLQFNMKSSLIDYTCLSNNMAAALR